MSPDQQIDMLDRFLATDGLQVRLSRSIDGIPISVNCQAFVRKYKPEELTGTIIQGDSSMILSPTQIVAAAWPEAQPVNTPDNRVPVVGDIVLFGGVPRAVRAATPAYNNGTLIRLDVQIRG